MQIKRLKIDDHLCLVDFEINFQTVDGGSSTILIGENGTGKSTMIDTVLEILMSFDSPAIEKNINYNYEIEYVYAGVTHVIVKVDHSYRVFMGDEEYEGSYTSYSIKKILLSKRIFPQRVIAFYSGSNNKLAEIIHHQNIQYLKKCRYALQTYLRSMNNDSVYEMPGYLKRKYNYCDNELTPIYLASILLGDSSFEKEYLQKACHFSHVDLIDVSINLDKVEQLFGKPKFNDEYPTNLYTIIDYLSPNFTDVFRRGFMYASFGKGYFELKDLNGIGVDSIAILELFEKLHSLFDAKYEASVSLGSTSVKVSNMSEGQHQLIKILGMLGICKSEDCLVLMDEPDAHMNPAWKYEIKDTIDQSLSEATNTQAIIATHDPLVINGVSKEFIRIFTYNQSLISNNGFYYTKVITPEEDTEGLGIDGLLQSEYYGLSSVLDSETRKKMDAKNDLLIKKTEGTLSEPEKHELKELSDELENMTFARNIPTDQYYDEYVAAMHKIYRDRPKTTLSADEIKERNAKAEEILRRLLEK